MIEHDKNANDEEIKTKEYNALLSNSPRNVNKNRENLLATMMHLGKQAFPNGVRVYNQKLNKMIKIGEYDKIKKDMEHIVANGRDGGAIQRVNNMIDNLVAQQANKSKIIAFLSKTKEEQATLITDAIKKVNKENNITRLHFKPEPRGVWYEL